MDKTLNECVRSMRIHIGLLKTFWDIVNTIIYLINKGISVLLNCRIPKKVWSDKKGKLFFF